MDVQPHIRCRREDAAEYAILPGDPARVERVKKYLAQVKEIAFNREYKSITGYYKGVKVLVMSTGMGGASVGIAIEELKQIGVKTMIRIGSCGALQKEIHLGDLIIANGAVRDEGTSKSYVESIYPAIPDTDLVFQVIEAAKSCGVSYYVGKVRSHDTFYTEREEEIDHYWSKKGILGADMETAALFTIGSLRGIRTASILNTVNEYEVDLTEEIDAYVNGKEEAMRGEQNEIRTALEACVRMEREHKKIKKNVEERKSL